MIILIIISTTIPFPITFTTTTFITFLPQPHYFTTTLTTNTISTNTTIITPIKTEKSTKGRNR